MQFAHVIRGVQYGLRLSINIDPDIYYAGKVFHTVDNTGLGKEIVLTYYVYTFQKF